MCEYGCVCLRMCICLQLLFAFLFFHTKYSKCLKTNLDLFLWIPSNRFSPIAATWPLFLLLLFCLHFYSISIHNETDEMFYQCIGKKYEKSNPFLTHSPSLTHSFSLSLSLSLLLSLYGCHCFFE